MTRIKTQKEKLNLSISREAKTKAKTIAAQMGITVSDLIEDMIMGSGFMLTRTEKEKN